MVANLTIWRPNAIAEINFISCLFYSVTEIPCPGCGMTQACISIAIARGDFEAASLFHPFSFILVGMAVAVSFWLLKIRQWWSDLP